MLRGLADSSTPRHSRTCPGSLSHRPCPRRRRCHRRTAPQSDPSSRSRPNAGPWSSGRGSYGTTRAIAVWWRECAPPSDVCPSYRYRAWRSPTRSSCMRGISPPSYSVPSRTPSRRTDRCPSPILRPSDWRRLPGESPGATGAASGSSACPPQSPSPAFASPSSPGSHCRFVPTTSSVSFTPRRRRSAAARPSACLSGPSLGSVQTIP